jgi:glycosyltransferase involved in cell wall biosynthesis
MNNSNKINIHIITGLGNGGAEEMLLRLMRAHNDFGVQNIVVSLNPKQLEKIKEFRKCCDNVISPTNYFFFFYIIKLIFKILIARNFNIVGWMYHGSFVASIIGFLTLIRPVYNIRHSLYDVKREKYITRLIIYCLKYLSYTSKLVVYNSNLSKKQHVSFGFSKKNLLFIPNGFDCNDLSIIVNKQYKPFVIGHMARYHPMKGHLIFVKAMLKLMDEGYDIRVNIAGEGFSNSDAEKIILNSRHSHKFSILGYVSNKSLFYNSINLFVSSSLWGEGFSNVILEAGAYAVPVVATDVGDASFILEGCFDVIPVDSTEAIAIEIKNYLALDYSKLEIKANSLRKKIISNYDFSLISRKYYDSWNL